MPIIRTPRAAMMPASICPKTCAEIRVDMIGRDCLDRYRSRFEILQELLRDTAVALDRSLAIAVLDQKSFEPQEPRFNPENILRCASSHERSTKTRDRLD